MVGKDGELGDIDDEGRARVKLIAEKKRELEKTADQVRDEISSCFERLVNALRARERQLLRQVEAVHRQHLALVQSNSDLLPADASLGAELSSESELLELIRDFGRIDLSNSIAVKDFEPYRAEEYQEAGEDLVSFDKSLKSEADEFDVSSVMRRKRDSKPVVINFNCTTSSSSSYSSAAAAASCDVTVKSQDSSALAAVASTSRQRDESQGADSPFVDNESDSDDSSEANQRVPSSPEDADAVVVVQNVVDDKEEDNNENPRRDENHTGPAEINDNENNDNASATVDAQDDKSSGKEGLAEEEHPKQIQQWLRQILAETETEPIVNEMGRPIVSQFPKMPNAAQRLYREFPVET